MAENRWQFGTTKTGVRQPNEDAVETGPHPWRLNVRHLNRWVMLLSPVLWLSLILSALSLLWLATWPDRIIESNTVILSSISPLPRVNPYAGRDAEALAGLQDLLQVNPFVRERLNVSQLEQAVAGIAELSQPYRSVFRRPTVNLVYVNCLGLALPQQDKLMPYLLPGDVYGSSSSVSERAVPVQKVLENLTTSNSSYKVLVLDCQQLDSFWPAGVISNQFVSSVRKLLNDKRGEYPNLFVLMSCSDNEVSWNDDSLGHSVFSRYFLQGITGAADQSGTDNRKVSLDELHEYVRTNVNLWTQKNRGVPQQAIMLYTGDSNAQKAARDVPLTIVTDGHPIWQAKSTTDKTNRKEELSELQTSWQTYYQTARSLPSPTSCAPQLFRLWEDSLLNAEARYRQHNEQSMRQAVNRANDYARQVRAAQERYSFGDSAFSLPMIQIFANPGQSLSAKSPINSKETKGLSERFASPKKNDVVANKASDAQTSSGKAPTADAEIGTGNTQQDAGVKNQNQVEEAKTNGTAKSTSNTTNPTDTPASVTADSAPAKPMTSAEIRSTMTEIQANTSAVAKYGKQFQEREHNILPAEAELVRMMADRWPTDKGQEPLRDFGHRVINSRIGVEQAAVPGGHFAYRIFPWVKLPMKEVDQKQREIEDLFFAIAGPPSRVDRESWNSLNNKMPSVDEITSAGQNLATAYGLRDQSISALPGLARFYRSSFISHDGQRAQIIEATTELVNANHQLCRNLRSVDDLDASNRVSKLQDLIAQSDRFAPVYFRLLKSINQEYLQLSESIDAKLYLSANQWKRLDAILKIPFDYSQRRRSQSSSRNGVSPFEFLESPSSLATRRVRLLERISLFAPERRQRPPESSPKEATVTPKTVASRSDEIATAEFATALFRLPDSVSTAVIPASIQNGFSSTLSEAWQDSYRAATSNLSDMRSNLIIGDLASRIIDPHLLESNWVFLERTPPQMLRAQQLSAFAQWHSKRRAGDLWSSLTGNGTPYYLKTSGNLDRLAKQFVSSQRPPETTASSSLDRPALLQATKKNVFHWPSARSACDYVSWNRPGENQLEG